MAPLLPNYTGNDCVAYAVLNDGLDKFKVPVVEDRSLKYNIEASDSFIGRKDTQINIHGQRLETGEVEHQRVIIRGIVVSMAIRSKGYCVGSRAQDCLHSN